MPSVSRPRNMCSSSSEICPFNPSNNLPVDGRCIVHAIAIGDQAIGVSAQIEQLIPVRAVARQPLGFVGHEDADLA